METPINTPPTGKVHPKKPGKRILLANVDAEGHFNPLTGIAVALREHGYEVRWYAPQKYAAKLQGLGIPLYPYQRALEIDPDKQDDYFPDRKKRKTQIGKLTYDLEHYFIRMASAFYEDIRDIHELYPFDLLIADITFLALPLVKHLLRKPVFAVGVIPLMQTSRDLAPYGLGLPPAQNGLTRFGHAVLRQLSGRVLFRRPNRLFNTLLAQHGIHVPLENMFDTVIRTATLVLQSGTPGFEYKRSDLTPNIRFIGPLLPHNPPLLTIDRLLMVRLTLFKKVILVTQGTVEKDFEKLIIPALEAFKETDYLLIVTTGGSGTKLLRERYDHSNVIIEDFIPFQNVMPQVDVFITNGGFGGVLLAITNQLPMVVAGVHEGKNEINARVDYFKLGINLKTERPTAVQLQESVAKILADPGYKQNCKALKQEFANYSVAGRCVQYTTEVLQAVS